ncbi:hypothetical protein ACFQL7_26175 [Halocatena marina]|uniref:alpha-L-rhamnosidase n=1 Tax=Halocatena marina TaxID=2934937 RepID=A0ABD5YVN1_9EURY
MTVPWHLYRHYGDIGVLERHYEGMRKYVDFWQDESDGGIVPDEYGTYGDWLAFENKDPELSSRGLPRISSTPPSSITRRTCSPK